MAINVGASIRAAQAIRKINNTKMAEDYGVARQQVHRWRTAEHMYTQKVEEFAKYFGMNLYDFLTLGEQ